MLDNAIQIVPPSGWLLTLALTIATAAAVLWSVYGTIPKRVIGLGTTLYEQAEVINISAGANGIVSRIHLETGDGVSEKTALIDLELIEEIDKEAQLKRRINALTKRLERTIAAGEARAKDARASFDEYEKSAQLKTSQLREQAAYYQGQLAEAEKLLGKGWMTADHVENIRKSLDSAQVAIAQTRVALAEKRVELDKEAVDERHSVEETRIQLHDAENSLAEVRRTLERYSTVRSPMAGQLREILPAVGESVAKGSVVARIEREKTKTLNVLAFFHPEDGKKLRVGMPALVSPSSSDRNIYGSIRGRVDRISERPIPLEVADRALGSTGFVTELAGGASPFQVEITLDVSESTPSGFEWTSSNGPPYPLSPGTISHVVVDQSEDRPISLLIPLLRSAIE